MTGAAAEATPPVELAARALAVQRRDQLAEDLAICANCPAAAPGGYLSRSLAVVEQLALTRCQPGWFEGDREDREHEQNRRDCAIVSQLLRAATDAVQGPLPSRAAWEATRRFLVAAVATLDDLLDGEPQPTGPHLRLILGGRP
jgi:hypothetical protein